MGVGHEAGEGMGKIDMPPMKDVTLPDHRAIKQYTDTGFEWGYPGDSPRQLVLAILFDHLGVASEAIAAVETFMKKVVAVLDNDWVLTSEQIDKQLKSQNGT